MDNFVAGFAYGLTTVAVGQPLDTIKTRMQALGQSSAIQTAKLITTTSGVAGLYKGGIPVILGGGLIRSAQFGVYETVIAQQNTFYGNFREEDRVFGVFNLRVVIAGFLGGIGRGLVEGPFEYIKTRKQVEQPWKVNEIFSGSAATIFRNSFLFSAFMIYTDLSKLVIPGGLSPFWSGAICSNLAWLTIWPMDVVKSQLQSGKYAGRSYTSLIVENFRTGVFFRGLAPGLTRSFIANGCSMVVYRKVLDILKEQRLSH
jgi:solute carrier family 25 (mitochondrial carnitine/acylcarnitine transporter), member 20/29